MEATRKAAEDSLRWQWKNNRAAFVTWLLLRLLVLAAMVYSAVQGEYENVFICILVLFLFLLFCRRAWALRSLRVFKF